MSELSKQQYFDLMVEEWARADADCRRYYLLWENAKARQKHLAAAKNNAWGDLQAANAEER